MDMARRAVLGAGVAVGAAMLVGTAAALMTDITPFALDPMPLLPKVPTPGKPGDFNWLTGEWRIRNRQPKPKTDAKAWIEFPGAATVHAILAGVGSVEELRIPERNFSGMGLRMLDVEKKVWSDYWVNAQSGVVTAPGVTGSFENGAGIFVSEDEQDGKPVKWAGVWDLITPKSCRWRQAVTRDAGKTWEQVWIMDWTRA
jgi:hypothetical protein